MIILTWCEAQAAAGETECACTRSRGRSRDLMSPGGGRKDEESERDASLAEFSVSSTVPTTK